MSRFLVEKHSALVPYIPGEQLNDKKYVKLNTNESPFPPSPGVEKAVAQECFNLQLYSDPECVALRAKMAEIYEVLPEQILMANGSDEILNFAFMAFADEHHPLAFPDITYGFYPVFAELNHIPYQEIPVKENLLIDPSDYIGIGKTIVIANPNAPTGICLPVSSIECIVKSNPDTLVIVDEAYVNFGGESAVPLIKKYNNLLITGTFSKSHSMAGARLGFCIADKKLIDDLNMIKYSTNPYNVNRMTAVAGIAALCDNDYYINNCKIITENREWTSSKLESLGFTVVPSKANFVFAKSDRISGKQLYLELKKRGVLIRHFAKDRIRSYNRITIGTMEQMQLLIAEIEKILRECAL